MALKFTTSYIDDSLELFRYYKKLAERAIRFFIQHREELFICNLFHL